MKPEHDIKYWRVLIKSFYNLRIRTYYLKQVGDEYWFHRPDGTWSPESIRQDSILGRGWKLEPISYEDLVLELL